MAERAIDYDRGVLINTDAISGMDIFMYYDQPGVYLNAHGVPVPEALAKSAGFDVEFYSKEKVKRDRMAAAKAVIENDLKDAKDETGEKIDLDGGYSIVGIGLGRYMLKDPDGNTLTETPLSKEHALSVAKLLAQPKDTKEQKPAAPAKK